MLWESNTSYKEDRRLEGRYMDTHPTLIYVAFSQKF